MLRSKFSRPLAVLGVVECLVFLACFLAARSVLNGVPFTDLSAADVGRLAGACLLLSTTMFAVGLYTWRGLANFSELLVRLSAAFFLTFLIYGTLVYMVSALRLPAGPMTTAFLLAWPALLLLRLVFMRLTKLTQLKSRILVLGTGKQAAQIEALEEQSAQSRFVIEGFVRLEDSTTAVTAERIVPAQNDLAAFAQRKLVDEVVLALEERRGRSPLQELVNLRLRGIEVTDYQGFLERARGCVDVDALRPSWFFHSEGFRSSPGHRAAKRAFDITVSSFLLLFTLPLLLLTAIAIRVESPGPIFYRQERMGRGGRPFVLIKFRSMREDAETTDTPQWAAEGDPRVTRIGAIIRKTRIDELPQIFNVLKGDMSFVGPRPERPYFVDMLASQIPFYQERHAVRPGITGWAQLNYPYGASVEDAKNKLEYDLFYIKYFSIVFDFSIVLQTARVVLWPDGAR